MDLTAKRLSFLQKLHLHSGRKVSVRELGREIFTTDRGIYLVLESFEKSGLVILEKGKKQLVVTVTPKGQKVIIENNTIK